MWVPVVLYGGLKAGCAYGILDPNEEACSLGEKVHDIEQEWLW